VLRPWLIALVAGVCAVTAAAIPRLAWADDIYVVEQADMTDSIKVQIDDQRVVVHAPEGFRIRGWGQGDEGSDAFVEVNMVGEGFDRIDVRFAPGKGSAKPGLRGRGVLSREIVPGATMTVFSRLPRSAQQVLDTVELVDQ